jgi:hypothetical protein
MAVEAMGFWAAVDLAEGDGSGGGGFGGAGGGRNFSDGTPKHQLKIHASGRTNVSIIFVSSTLTHRCGLSRAPCIWMAMLRFG